MGQGVFAIARGIFGHEFFSAEPFTEREAWIWLIGEAAWRDHAQRVGKVVVHLKRGQCAFSVRFLAEKWGWSKSRVDRFLTRLETETMIGTAAGQHITVVTICNYNEYQRVSLPANDVSGTVDGTAAGTAAGQRRRQGNTIY